jgi:uncharacterized membrane protein
MNTQLTMKQSVYIQRPTEDIFTYMTAGEHLADWSSAVIGVRTTPSGLLHGGSRLRLTTRFLGQWLETTFEVVECQPSSHLTFKSTTGIVPCVFSYQFDATRRGTLISLETIISLHPQAGRPGFGEGVIGKIVKRQIQHDLLTLKDVMEAGAE